MQINKVIATATKATATKATPKVTNVGMGWSVRIQYCGVILNYVYTSRSQAEQAHITHSVGRCGRIR